jgi:signal peptidase I
MTSYEQRGPEGVTQANADDEPAGNQDGPAAGQPGPAEEPGATPDTPAQGDAAPGRRRARHRKQRSFWVELPLLLATALVIALVIKTFVVQAFYIPSSSMEETLMVGDKVLVNKLVYHFRKIEPGDIVVFNGAGSWTNPAPSASPSSDPLVRAYDATLGRLFHSIAGLYGTPVDEAGTVFIKRVIGVPGDRVVCCNAQGLVTVNGVPLHEQSYLYPGESPGDAPAGYPGHFNIVVPPGRLWVLGDNRAVSDDSRLRQSDPGHGTIPENEVIGRAFVIVWPPSRWRILQIPSTFSQPGIDSPAAASATAAVVRDLPVAAAASLPFLPLAGGIGVAFPLFWVRRRVRAPSRRRP